MKERILEFLKAENKSSAQLAEEIGVQPSGISHILSGRNNPSLDFILRMLEKYHYISTDWLLFGKGSMYKEGKMQSLFDESSIQDPNIDFKNVENEQYKPGIEVQPTTFEVKNKDISETGMNKALTVSKIVWFYENNSFEEYFPKR
jgi:transcriptional regulator with XRE-family HTH domain